MLTSILRNKIRSGRMFVATSAIIATGLVSTFPDILVATFCVQFSYEVLHVMTVTLFYINGVCNPLIYLCSNPRVQRQIYPI